MGAQKIPNRILVLIAIHVSTTAVLGMLVWAVTPPDFTPDPFGFFWLRSIFSYVMISQIYLVVFWTCLGQSAWVGRLAFGPMILGGLGAAFSFASWDENWARRLLWLLIQLLVLAAPLLVLRLMGRRLVTSAPEREIGVSSLRWSLKELLVAMTLATVYIALVRFLNVDGGQLGVNSAIVPLVGLACVVPMFFAARWWKVILAAIVLEAILTAIITWISLRRIAEDMIDVSPSELEAIMQDLFYQVLFMNAIAISIITIIIGSSLLVVRSCGYRWSRCEDAVSCGEEEHSSSLILANRLGEEPQREND